MKYAKQSGLRNTTRDYAISIAYANNVVFISPTGCNLLGNLHTYILLELKLTSTVLESNEVTKITSIGVRPIFTGIILVFKIHGAVCCSSGVMTASVCS